KSSFAWQSAKGKGKTDETLSQSQLIAQGDIVIQAVEGLNIDIKHIDQKTVSQSIDAMVKADPNLAWLKEMEQRGDVDWQRVKEIHDSFKYSSSGLGAGASLMIAIAVAYFTAGAMSGLAANGATAAGASTAATSAGGAWAAGTGGSLSGIGWANAAVTAGLTGMASNTAISTINNRGNLGAILKDVTSEDALRGYVVAGATAGLTNGLYNGWTGTETGASGALANSGKVITEGGLNSWSGIGQFAGNQLLQNGTSAVLDRALGGDSSLSDALRSSLANTFAAAGFNLVGDLTAPGEWDFKDGSPVKVAMHAVMGGLAAEAAGGDFKAGALAAGVNELLVDSLAKQYGEMDPDQKKSLLVMNSQVIGVLAVAAQGGDEKALQAGAWVAGSATQYNYLSHAQEEQKEKELKECQDRFCQIGTEAKWNLVSAQQDLGLVVGVGGGIGLSAAETVEGLYQLVTNLPEVMDTLKLLASSSEFRQQFGDSYFGDLEQRAALLTQAYNDAGWQGSVTAGVEGARFAAELVGVLTAVRGTAQVAAKLPSAAKNVVNVLAEAPAPSGWKAQVGAVGDLSKLDVPGVPKGGLPPLRQAYVNEVKALEDIALNMRAAGASPEQVARQLHQMRRDLGVQYKDLTPAPQLEVIYARDALK
ncbi:DUF637 domain-containing protein, partial [Pseudomonas lopnurensis]|uniref:DUF637 domain-containing protein n=1 Tax=Pseudomonas lopnurensis TaxID=1477517 RepID=UPI0028AE0844